MFSTDDPITNDDEFEEDDDWQDLVKTRLVLKRFQDCKTRMVLNRFQD